VSNKELSDSDLMIWKRMNEAYLELLSADRPFWEEGTNRVALIRHALSTGDKYTAFYIAPHMKTSELMELLDVWVDWAASVHGLLHVVRDIIKSLPREWVLENIEAHAEPLLSEGTYDEYRRLMELYYELDPALALKLANRAITSSDPDIQEAGEDTIEWVKQLG
jgi:hypothetical protein